MERILILGSGGAGKSTLAKELGRILDVQVIHIDAHSWKPGWNETPHDELESKLQELASGEKWVMDGNYSKTLPMRVERADTLIYLDISRIKCLYRILKRRVQYHKRSRPDIGEGCPEKIDMEFIKWVWGYRNRARKRHLSMLNTVKNEKKIIILKNNKDVKNFLSSVYTLFRSTNNVQ